MFLDVNNEQIFKDLQRGVWIPVSASWDRNDWQKEGVFTCIHPFEEVGMLTLNTPKLIKCVKILFTLFLEIKEGILTHQNSPQHGIDSTWQPQRMNWPWVATARPQDNNDRVLGWRDGESLTRRYFQDISHSLRSFIIKMVKEYQRIICHENVTSDKFSSFFLKIAVNYSKQIANWKITMFNRWIIYKTNYSWVMFNSKLLVITTGCPLFMRGEARQMWCLLVYKAIHTHNMNNVTLWLFNIAMV